VRSRNALAASAQCSDEQIEDPGVATANGLRSHSGYSGEYTFDVDTNVLAGLVLAPAKKPFERRSRGALGRRAGSISVTVSGPNSSIASSSVRSEDELSMNSGVCSSAYCLHCLQEIPGTGCRNRGRPADPCRVVSKERQSVGRSGATARGECRARVATDPVAARPDYCLQKRPRAPWQDGDCRKLPSRCRAVRSGCWRSKSHFVARPLKAGTPVPDRRSVSHEACCLREHFFETQPSPQATATTR